MYYQAAKKLAAILGAPVIPCRGKAAAAPWGAHASLDGDTLRRAFRRKNITGIAAVHLNGVVCRDFDDLGAYETWRRAWPDLAEVLPTVRTARGCHVWFHCTGAKFQTFVDGELRAGAGHYTMLPPSIHPSGVVYEWLVPPRTLPELDPHKAGLYGNVSQSTTVNYSQLQSTSLSRLLRNAVDVAIEETLPTAKGQRNRRIFEFVCALKRTPRYANSTPAEVKPLARRWYEAALPVIGTQDWLTSWEDFVIAWERYDPDRSDGLKAAFEEAAGMPVPEKLEEFDSPELVRVANVCRVLADRSPTGQFYLSQRAVAALFGVAQMTISRWLKVLRGEGVIELARPHEISGGELRAAEYRMGSPAPHVHEHRIAEAEQTDNGLSNE